VQIVQLATIPLREACAATCRETLDELDTTAAAAHASLDELLVLARPDPGSPRGAPVGATVLDVLATLRGVIEIDVHVTVSAETATRCSAEELEHLLIGLVLDVVDEHPAIALHVRERMIADRPWIEILRVTRTGVGGDGFELRAVHAIVDRAAGEIATSATREGGTELVVALPIVP
jgi:hypothetical protein